MTARPDLQALLLARRHAATGEGRALRLRAGLSVREMAAAGGLSASALYRWENNQRVPHGDGAVRYGRLLDDLSQILGPVPA